MPSETYFNLPEEKRSRLLNVLLDEFAENDYKNVSVGRIAARAGIAKGSFYQYFSDKRDCYLYLISLGIEEKSAFLRQPVPMAQENDLFLRLRWLLDAGLQFQFSSPRLAKIGYKAIFDDVPLPEETLRVIRRGAAGFFKQMITAGVANGSLKPDLDADTAAFILNAVFTGLGQELMDRFAIQPDQLLHDGAQLFEHAGLRQAIDQVLTILEQGMRAEIERKI